MTACSHRLAWLASAAPSLAAALLLLLSGTVEAGTPEQARTALDEGRREAARQHLEGYVEQAAPGADALLAAEVASELYDVALLTALQERLEGAPGTKEPGPGALALAAAWLGLAEAHLVARDQSSSVPYLFADAEKKARSLLLQTDMSVINVALACGFSSPSHFSKCYRAYYGRTPYRERGIPVIEHKESA